MVLCHGNTNNEIELKIKSMDRISEGEKCLEKAQKYLKTSLLSLKFKPDYDSAASEFERAAVCFKNAKDLKRCVDAHLKAAECYENNNSIFHAAKSKENAALVYRDLGEAAKTKQLIEDAARLYAESGTSESAAGALDKAARIFEPTDPEIAVELFEKAFKVVSDTDKTRQASEYLRKITGINIRLEKYADAIDSLRREVELYKDLGEPGKIGRLTAGVVLLQLALGDSVAAAKEYASASRVQGFETTEDAITLRTLIAAYEDGDEERFQSLLNRPHMRNLDNDLLKLMKKLKAPNLSKSMAVTSIEDEGDDFSGGLC